MFLVDKKFQKGDCGMKTKKKILWASLFPTVALATGMIIWTTSCASNGSSESETPTPPPTPETPDQNLPPPKPSAPTKNLPGAIGLDQYINTIQTQLMTLKEVDSSLSLFNHQQAILKNLNQTFSALTPNYDVVFQLNYDLESHPGQCDQLTQINFELNPSFNYNLLESQNLVNFSFNNQTKILTYKLNLTTQIPFQVFQPNLAGFDPNVDNQYNVWLRLSNNNYLDDDGIDLKIVCPDKLPAGYGANSQLTYQVYYSSDYDQQDFSHFSPVINNGTIEGNLSGSFSLGQQIQLKHLNQAGIYLVNFKFRSDNQPEVNLLCGVKVFDQLQDVNVGSYQTNRSFGFNLPDSATTKFCISPIQYNGTVLDNGKWQKYGVLRPNYHRFDLSQVQVDGQYNFQVTYQDTNPLTCQYANSQVLNLNSVVNNPLKNITFNVTDTNRFLNTATLSLTQKSTPKLYNQSTNNDNAPSLIDSVTKNGNQAIVYCYQRTGNADQPWVQVTDLDNQTLYSNVQNINQTLNRAMPVSLSLNKAAIKQAGSAYLLTVESGNGYRFNLNNSQYFQSYAPSEPTDWNITKNYDQLALPQKAINYQLVQGNQLGNFANDSGMDTNSVIIGSPLVFQASGSGVDSHDIQWQYQTNHGQWTDIDNQYVSVNEQGSILSIPGAYNCEFDSFQLRVISKTYHWVAQDQSSVYTKAPTPQSIFKISGGVLQGFADGFDASAQNQLGAIYLPTSASGTIPYCFQNNPNVHGVYVPSSYSSLGISCFNGCANLKFADLNASNLTIIPDSCFLNCTKMTSLKFEQSHVTTLHSYVFKNTSLTSFVAPATLQRLDTDSMQIHGTGYDADFSKCQSVSVDTGAFWQSQQLHNFYGTQNLVKVGKNAFYNCVNMNPNGNECLILGPNFRQFANEGNFYTNSPLVKYLVIESDQFNYTRNWIGNNPNLKTILFKTQAIADKWMKDGKALMVGNNSFDYQFKTNYQGYLVYQTSDAPAFPPASASLTVDSMDNQAQDSSVVPSSTLTSNATIDLTVQLPTQLPKALQAFKNNQVQIQGYWYYAPVLNETNPANYYQIVSQNPGAHQVLASELGISNSLNTSLQLGQKMAVSGIKQQGTYLFYVSYWAHNQQVSCLYSEYHTVNIPPLIP